MPWRNHPDPYAIWVAEIMLQQTQVETVIPYFHRWMAHFPTIESLARAPEQEVLKLWEGLGYYQRARNLHQAAKIVMQHHAGTLPPDRHALQSLPGVGPYTAGAIASFAFGLNEAVVDGNVSRVLARVFNIALPPRSAEGQRELWHLARTHLPAGQAKDYNQALMDLGASICKAKNPNCAHCPLVDICQANILGIQAERPVTATSTPRPQVLVTAAVGKVLIAQRLPERLLGGLWEFPGGKRQPDEDLITCLKREIQEELSVTIEVGDHIGVFRHAYSHFRVTLHAYHCQLLAGEPQPKEHTALAWAEVTELPHFPMGKLDRQIARTIAHG
jgi:A/G-specific adenine glycosylase